MRLAQDESVKAWRRKESQRDSSPSRKVQLFSSLSLKYQVIFFFVDKAALAYQKIFLRVLP